MGDAAAALALGLAAAVVVAAPAGAKNRLRLVLASRPEAVPRSIGRWRPPDSAHRALAAAAAVVVLALAGALAGPVGAVAVTAYGAAGWRALHLRARTSADTAARAAGGTALAGLADDLRAGSTPMAALHTAVLALERAAAEEKVRSALAAVRAAVDGQESEVVPALRAVPGPLAPALHRLAAAWSLTDSGIPLAEVVERLDVELRQHRRAVDRAQAHTASARMTARLVALLPLLGLGIGQLLGAHPFAVLTGRPAGAMCAVAAIALHLVGFAWAARLGRVVAR